MSAAADPKPPHIPPARQANVNAEKNTIESPRLKYPFVGANGTKVAIVTAAVNAVSTPYRATNFGDTNSFRREERNSWNITTATSAPNSRKGQYFIRKFPSTTTAKMSVSL